MRSMTPANAINLCNQLAGTRQHLQLVPHGLFDPLLVFTKMLQILRIYTYYIFNSIDFKAVTPQLSKGVYLYLI